MNVYADTSTIGGCEDEEFQEWSLALHKEFVAGRHNLMLSDLTLQELEEARASIQDRVKQIPQTSIIEVEINDEAISLAETYINEGALTNKSYNHALHI